MIRAASGRCRFLQAGMNLILITPDHFLEQECALVNACFAYGLQRLHLRKKKFSEQDYRNYIGSIDTAFHQRIVLTEYFGLLTEFDLGGVHLNSHIRDQPATWEELAALQPRHTSASFHSWDEINAAANNFDYVLISPVFDSISKKGYKAGIDLKGAAILKQVNTNCPGIVGLGGVQANNIRLLQAAHFDGAALLGAVWEAADPFAAFRELCKHV